MSEIKLSSEFLEYLVDHHLKFDRAMDGDDEYARLPSLNELSKELGVSVAGLREQLEVAKALGLVEVRPRTGIRCKPYTFLPAVRESLSYAIALDWSNFIAFSDLRNHVEAAYWEDAARKLTAEDHQKLKGLVARAWEKLRGQRIQIPHSEHRQLHLAIFSRLENPFVLGILEAYWDAYEAVGLNIFADYKYLQQVWDFHQQMVDSICEGEYGQGYKALVEHWELLYHRPQTLPEAEVEAV